MKHTINDFKIGDTVYLKCINDAARRKTPCSEECILEGKVEKVGRKYVTVDGQKYEETPIFDGLLEVSDYSPDYILYPTKQEILDKFEYEKLYFQIHCAFSMVISNKTVTLDQLRRITSILAEGEKS